MTWGDKMALGTQVQVWMFPGRTWEKRGLRMHVDLADGRWLEG